MVVATVVARTVAPSVADGAAQGRLGRRASSSSPTPTSRKGAELAGNPRCALLFPWHPLERQVRVDGIATPLPRARVDAYFAVRPRGSQLGAWASHQSPVGPTATELEAAYADGGGALRRRDVPTPEEWGGYLVRPEAVEFWQGRPAGCTTGCVYRRTTARAGRRSGSPVTGL